MDESKLFPVRARLKSLKPGPTMDRLKDKPSITKEEQDAQVTRLRDHLKAHPELKTVLPRLTENQYAVLSAAIWCGPGARSDKIGGWVHEQIGKEFPRGHLEGMLLDLHKKGWLSRKKLSHTRAYIYDLTDMGARILNIATTFLEADGEN